MTQNPMDWIGKTQVIDDVLNLEQACLMQSIMQSTYPLKNGAPLPPLWHWLYFLTALPPSELGRDGHPKPGPFMPPLILPRRMWAGSRFWFHQPLIIGQPAQKTSTIQSIEFKAGQSGPLCFVTICHEIKQGSAKCLSEEQDLVFREDPKNGSIVLTNKCPTQPEISTVFEPHPITLFRYSALTFNGHRIHYDRQYCQNVEGYQSLVVHGPLIGTLLAQAASGQVKDMSYFSFKAKSPAFDTDRVYIEGTPSTHEFWARKQDGTLIMEAQAQYL